MPGFAVAHTCTRTGLRLVAVPSHALYRVGDRRFHPLSPPVRSAADKSPGRWDTVDGRTLYLGSTALAAFAEALPYGRENLPTVKLVDLFDDVDADDADATLAAAVRGQAPAPTVRNRLTRDWIGHRQLHEVTTTRAGWLVDIHAAATLNAINDAMAWTTTLAPAGHTVERLTLAELFGEDRDLTMHIATWIRGLVLDDGSLPVGIRYASKRGDDLDVYAIWLRALDDGKSLSREIVRLSASRDIDRSDPDLKQAANLVGLEVC